MAALSAALRAMAGQHAVLIGDFMLDAYLYGATQRVSREAPVLVVREERREERLGGAANTAANLRALGVATTVVGCVGDDAAGRTVAAMLDGLGCDTTHLLRVNRRTAVKTRILAGAFGTTRQQVLRLDSEPDGDIPAGAEAALAAALPQLCAAADVLIVSDYGGGCVTAALATAVRALAAAGHRVCVDSRHRLGDFSGVDVITPNTPEAEAAVGFAIDGPAAVARASRELLGRLGVGACLLTQGAHGMSLCLPAAAPAHVPVVGEHEVTDVTGAGDTVIATLAAAYAAGLGLHNGMLLANCAAGVVVTKRGAACAAPEEVAAAAHDGGVVLHAW